MCLKGFQQTILPRNSNYLSILFKRSKYTKSISNSIASTKLLNKITSSPITLPYRNYVNNTRHDVLFPTLTDDQPIKWPNLFYALSIYIKCHFVVKPFLDNEFSLDEFLVGANQALFRVSAALAKEDYDSIRNFVADETLAKIKPSISRLTPNQKQLLEIRKDDIYDSFPYQLQVMFDKDNEDNTKFVEIMVVYYSIRGKGRINLEKKMVFNDLNTLSECSQNLLVTNYRFVREYTKGKKSFWTINMINQFVAVDV